MFKNIGRKVKGLAQVLCWLGIVASVIYALVSFSNLKSSKTAEVTGIVYSACIFGLASWIASWVIYAIGEAAENSATIVEQNKQILRALGSGDPHVSNRPAASNFHSEPSRPVSSGASGDQWICPRCRCANSKVSSFCVSCGEQRR